MVSQDQGTFLDFKNSTFGDTFVNLSIVCPENERDFSQVGAKYQEAFGVSVEKTYLKDSIPMSVDYKGNDCFVNLLVEGLQAARKYDVCISLTGTSGTIYGPHCEMIRTIPTIPNETISINMEGVALIVLTALGLLFALMACVFHEKFIAQSMSDCHSYATKCWRRGQDKVANSRKKTQEPQQPTSETPNAPQNVQPSPKGNKPLANGTCGPKPNETDDDEAIRKFLAERPRLLKQSTVLDPQDDLNIREVLHARPGLMRQMRPHKDVPSHETGSFYNQGFQDEYTRFPSVPGRSSSWSREVQLFPDFHFESGQRRQPSARFSRYPPELSFQGRRNFSFPDETNRRFSTHNDPIRSEFDDVSFYERRRKVRF